MDTASWPKVRRILESAMDRPPHRRDRLVDRACRGDPELLRQVRELLSREPVDDRWLDGPIPGAASSLVELSDFLARNERIAHYRIVEPIAVGGMGMVLRGVDESSPDACPVAIKVIRGLASRRALLSFRREQRLLARLDHPNITRLLDTGLTVDKLPYIVMEFVDGLPIDEHARRASLTIEQRLNLFRFVCLAVHFAHQNLVVHRDLKPANILVTQTGQVKLLDFGIAKYLHGPHATTGAETLSDAMTLRYSSPEQIRGQAITTATDVYSLGVILYELLAERPPYELANCSRYEAERIICERKPSSPGHALPSMIGRKPPWSEGLDRIVMMAMHKEPARRYPSAEQFAEDIGRYVNGLDLRAHQPGRFEWAIGALRRHRLASTLAAAAFAIISTLAVVSMWTARAAGLSRDREMEARQVAERIGSFTSNLLAAAGPAKLGPAGAGLQVLEEASQLADRDLANHPDLAAGIYQQIGQAYYHLRRSSFAERNLRLALANYRKCPLVDVHQLADCLELLADILSYRDDQEGLSLQREALELRRQDHQENTLQFADSLHGLGFALTRCARPPRYQEAEDLYRQALAIRERLGAGQTPATARILHALAALMRHQDRLLDADRIYKQALELNRCVLSPLDQGYIDCLNDYALCLEDLKRFDQAAELLNESLRLASQSFDEIAAADALCSLARVARARGDRASARRLLHQSLSRLCDFIVTRRSTDLPLHAAARCQALAERFGDESAAPQHRAYDEFLAIVPVSNRASHVPPCAYCRVLDQLAALSVEDGEYEIAQRLSTRAIAMLDQFDPGERLTRAHLSETLAGALNGVGRTADARKLLSESVQVLTACRGPAHRETRAAAARLLALYPPPPAGS